MNCVRILLERIWYELLKGSSIDISSPVRRPKTMLVHPKRESEFARAVEYGLLKLSSSDDELSTKLVLVLVDADNDLPCQLGPRLTHKAREARPDANIACVVANIDYETWFVASAQSLTKYLRFKSESEIPTKPEDARAGKKWVQEHWIGTKYSPTVDQPKLTAAMDLELCRSRSPSFQKLCRELERFL